MSISLYQLSYLLTNLFSIAILHRLMNTFFEKKTTKRFVCIMSYLFYFVLTSIVYLFFDIPTLTLIVNWLIIFLITLNYESSMQNRVFVSVNIIFFMSITEIIVGVCSGYFRFSFFEKGNYRDIMGLMISKISAYMIAIMFQKFKALKKNEQVSPFEWVASLSIGHNYDFRGYDHPI